MVWLERNPTCQTTRSHFWRGTRHIETIEIADHYMDRHVEEGEDPMSYIWKLFCAAQGEPQLIEGVDYKGRPALLKVEVLELPVNG